MVGNAQTNESGSLMKTYGLYKVITADYTGAGRIIMSHTDIRTLHAAANAYFAKPENFVGRFNQQLTIPMGKFVSNRVSSDGGGQCVDIYIEIRVVDLPGLK